MLTFRQFIAEATVDDYQGEHKAPGPPDASPLWDLTLKGTYPDDVYGPRGLQYYGTGDDALDRAAYAIVMRQRRHPNRPQTIYRAVPRDVSGPINTGDWVTTVKAYAVQHGRGALNGDYRILSKTVYPRDLFTDGNSWLEFGYHPQPFVPETWKRKQNVAESDDGATFPALATLQREFPNVTIELQDKSASYGDRTVWYLANINVPKPQRRAGIGTRVMQRMIELADEAQATIALTPSADFGSSVARLTTFYGRFGFKKNSGRTADPSITGTMIRVPQAVGATPTVTAPKKSGRNTYTLRQLKFPNVGVLNTKTGNIEYVAPRRIMASHIAQTLNYNRSTHLDFSKYKVDPNTPLDYYK